MGAYTGMRVKGRGSRGTRKWWARVTVVVTNTKVSSKGQGWFKDPKVKKQDNKKHTIQGHAVDQRRGG